MNTPDSVDQQNIPYHYLNPGEMVFCEKPTKVGTILGSCISITFFCPKLKVGAICHALLPEKRNSTEEPHNPFKYVKDSIEEMVQLFKKKCITVKGIETKLFGGSDMFQDIMQSKIGKNVGHQNINMALNLIDHYNLILKAQDTGGRQGRRLIFFSHTGDVYVKKIKNLKEINSKIRSFQ